MSCFAPTERREARTLGNVSYFISRYAGIEAQAGSVAEPPGPWHASAISTNPAIPPVKRVLPAVWSEDDAWHVARGLAEKLAAPVPKDGSDAALAGIPAEVIAQLDVLFAGLHRAQGVLAQGRMYGVAVGISPGLAELFSARYGEASDDVLAHCRALG